MNIIYEPKGKAREYSPLALNVYTGGCDHGCKYCYCKNIQRGWSLTPKCRDLSSLVADAAKSNRQILLSFISDPYCTFDLQAKNTRNALKILMAARCSVAILTKGGTRCLRDLDLFKAWPDGRIKIGATLTFSTDLSSLATEPGAALPQDRIEALKILHENGIKTWASIEPVVDPVQSLEIIGASLPYCDGYKIGKLNHVKNATDWGAFGNAAIAMVRDSGKMLYVKEDLRPYLSGLSAAEVSSETLTLPDRPARTQLMF